MQEGARAAGVSSPGLRGPRFCAWRVDSVNLRPTVSRALSKAHVQPEGLSPTAQKPLSSVSIPLIKRGGGRCGGERGVGGGGGGVTQLRPAISPSAWDASGQLCS